MAKKPRLITIHVLGRPLCVQAERPLLESLRDRFPERVARGRFCWKHECGSSKFFYRLPDDPLDRKARMCRFHPIEGMEITTLSAELKFVLEPFLNETTD